MKIRTVKIVSNGVPLVINESDFRHGSDVLWDEYAAEAGAQEEGPSLSPAALEAQIKAEKEEAAVENEIEIKHKGGGRWTVTVNGQSVHEGTLSKAEAQVLAAEY